MKPNASLYNPDPMYLRQLVALTGLSQERCAAAIGVAPRTFRYYLSTAADHQDAPYTVQFALESLAGGEICADCFGERQYAELGAVPVLRRRWSSPGRK